MSVTAARPSAAAADASDLLTRARAIGALARERAQQTEADRRVGDDMIERMRQADLFRVMQPRSYGGLEYGFDVFAQIVAAIASGCGSTGWVYALLASHQWLIACFSKAAQDEVWQERSALAAGTYAPVAQAVAVDGGYRLSGVGSFCSGCDNAQWQLLGGMIPQLGAAAKPGFFLLRSTDCVIDDNWHTMGLAGTGSKNIVARDVFVPTHRTLAFAELADAAAPGMRANPNPLYRQSFLAVLPIAIVSPVLGMAEGALADFLAMAGIRTTAAPAIVQNAPEGSPATKEQFFGQSPRGSHHGRKCSSPPNSATSIGRGRPQCSLSTRLATTPGASASVTSISTIARPGMSSGRRGRMNLTTRATTAGIATSVVSQTATSRARR